MLTPRAGGEPPIGTRTWDDAVREDDERVQRECDAVMARASRRDGLRRALMPVPLPRPDDEAP